jgi:hypothetical protein
MYLTAAAAEAAKARLDNVVTDEIIALRPPAPPVPPAVGPPVVQGVVQGQVVPEGTPPPAPGLLCGWTGFLC